MTSRRKLRVAVALAGLLVIAAALLRIQFLGSKPRGPMAGIRHIPPDYRTGAGREMIYVTNFTDRWLSVLPPEIQAKSASQEWTTVGVLTNRTTFLAPHSEDHRLIPSHPVSRQWRVRIRVAAEARGMVTYWHRAQLWWHLRKIGSTGSLIDTLRNGRVYAGSSEELASSEISD